MEIQGPDGGEATTQSVLKVVTCNLFEIDLEEHKSTGGKTGARGRGNGRGGGGGRARAGSLTFINSTK